MYREVINVCLCVYIYIYIYIYIYENLFHNIKPVV